MFPALAIWGNTMARRIFITATNTDIGKTYTTLKLLRHYAAQGYRVGALKPIETGVSDLPPDGNAILETLKELNPEFADMNVRDIVPVQYKLPAAPYVASQGQPIDYGAIERALAAVERRCDILIIEGAGGLLVPVDADTMILDMIRILRAKALLVSHCRLGCINDTLLNMTVMEHAGIDYAWVLNCKHDDASFRTVSLPYFKARFATVYTLENDLDALASELLK